MSSGSSPSDGGVRPGAERDRRARRRGRAPVDLVRARRSTRRRPGSGGSRSIAGRPHDDRPGAGPSWPGDDEQRAAARASSVACRASGSAPSWAGGSRTSSRAAAQARAPAAVDVHAARARPRAAPRPSRPCRPSAPTGRRAGSSRPGSAAAGPRRPCSWSTSRAAAGGRGPARATRLGRARAQSSPIVVSWRATMARSIGLPPFQQFSTTSHGWRARSSPSSSPSPAAQAASPAPGSCVWPGGVAAGDGLEVVQEPGQPALARPAGRARPAPSARAGSWPRQRAWLPKLEDRRRAAPGGEPVGVLPGDRRVAGRVAEARTTGPGPARAATPPAASRAGRRGSARWGASRRPRAPSPCRR